jgi:CRP-like cAMP-binding protein
MLFLEGHPVLSMCFVISGEVVVSQLTQDRITKEFADTPINILGASDFFGHVGLMHDDRRLATCITESK